MPVIGPRLVLDAIHSFLTTNTGEKRSLNVEIESYVIQEGMSASELPTIVAFNKGCYLGSQEPQQSPTMSIVWDSTDGETLNNSRILPHHFTLYLMILDGNLAGNEQAVQLRALDYVAVVMDMFLRGTSAGAKGYTLNNGTGTSVGRINRATIDRVDVGVDDDFNDANLVLAFGLTVESIEDYPG